MNWDVAGPAGLRFFGGMTALTTHELNNCLGIINENAGLLEDLVLMAGQGAAVDPERWLLLSERISGQVRRADGIIRCLNSFAHSVDSDRTGADIGALLEVTVSLSGRLLAGDRVRAVVERPEERVVLTTAPFHFMHLFGRCLVFAARHVAEPEREIRVACAPAADGGATVTLGGLDRVDAAECAGEIEQELLAALKGRIRRGDLPGELLLELSGDPAS